MRRRPLVRLEDSLLSQCGASTIVTSNSRLKRAWLDAIDRQSLDSGARPRVFELGEYLRERYQDMARLQRRVLLSSEAERLVWLDLAPALDGLRPEDVYPR